MISEMNKSNDLLQSKAIFNGKYAQQIIASKVDPTLETLDHFQVKKQFKFEQYNKLIKLSKNGKRKFNLDEVILGKKKNHDQKYRVPQQYSSSEDE